MTVKTITYPHLSKFHKTTIDNDTTLDQKIIDKLIRCFDKIEDISLIYVTETLGRYNIRVRFYLYEIGMLENMNLREAGFTIRHIDFQCAAIELFYMERSN